jgi:ABC transport system ATP-binding/permease protein
MFKLVICDDEGKTTIVPLIRDEITIGRKEGNTIRLTDRNVSRQHAQLLRQGDNDFLVTDLNSRNGTKVNGEGVPPDKPHKVTPGDQIYIGDYNLSVRTDVSAGVPMGRQMDPGDTAGIGKVTPHARLVMLAGPEPGTEFELTVNLYVVGRSEEANLRIDDASISRAHARLDGDEQQWTISDLDSINGIMINGQRRDDYLLKSGDVIELGVVRLRFVAPGEPYEYSPGDAMKVVSAPPKKKSNKLFFLLGGIAVVAAAAIIVAIALGRSHDEPVKTVDNTSVETPKSFEELVEAGKDKMQAESWDEAARLFAEAQQQKPDDARVRELKNTSLAEMEAQTALVAALGAEQAQNHRAAVDDLAKIPRSSRYYDVEHVRKETAALCEQLIASGIQLVERNGQAAEVERIIAEIGLLPEMADECRSDREALLLSLTRRQERDHEGEPLPPEDATGTSADKKPKKSTLPANPYENPYSSSGGGGSKAAGAASGGEGKAAGTASGAKAGGPKLLDAEAPPNKKGANKMTWDTP